jgi:hypothetical protein
MYEVFKEACPLERRTLRKLEPIGIGTGQCESLYSWLLRLADSLCVVPLDLFRFLVAASAKEDIRKLGSRNDLGRVISAISVGTDKRTYPLVSELCRITSQNELACLTLMPQSEFLPGNGRGAKARKWCPLCIEESRRDGVIYHRLLWEVGACLACPIHQIKLHNSCGRCGYGALGSSLGHFAPSLLFPGYCFHCGGWLGFSCSKPLVIADSQEIKDSYLLSDWISCNGQAKEWRQGNVRDVILHVVHNYFGGYWTRMAKSMGFGKVTFHGWVHGTHSPNLWHLLRLADLLNITLDQLCQGEITTLKLNSDKSYVSRLPKSRAKNNWNAIEEKLNMNLAVEPPLSLSQTCRNFGIDAREVRRFLPALAGKIVIRYSEYCQKQRAKRWGTVFAAAQGIVQRDGTFTKKTLHAELKILGFSLSWRELAAICQILRQQGAR